VSICKVPHAIRYHKLWLDGGLGGETNSDVFCFVFAEVVVM